MRKLLKIILIATIAILASCCTPTDSGDPVDPVSFPPYRIEETTDGSNFKFAVFGDLQSGYESSFILASTRAEDFGAELALYVGDIIDDEGDWNKWNDSALQIPTVATPGNHEYSSGARISPNWDKVFEFPDNGPKNTTSNDICGRIHQLAQIEAAKNTVYYVDYKNVRFISLNSMTREARQDIQGNVQDLQWNGCSASEVPYDYWMELQREWLRETLDSSTAEYNVVTFHHSMISSTQNRNSTLFRENWSDILKNADIVFTGHDHIYSRVEYHDTWYVSMVTGSRFHAVDMSDWSRAGTVPEVMLQRQSVVGLLDTEGCLDLKIMNANSADIVDSLEVC